MAALINTRVLAKLRSLVLLGSWELVVESRLKVGIVLE
jgi:hypothetical protein